MLHALHGVNKAFLLPTWNVHVRSQTEQKQETDTVKSSVRDFLQISKSVLWKQR